MHVFVFGSEEGLERTFKREIEMSTQNSVILFRMHLFFIPNNMQTEWFLKF